MEARTSGEVWIISSRGPCCNAAARSNCLAVISSAPALRASVTIQLQAMPSQVVRIAAVVRRTRSGSTGADPALPSGAGFDATTGPVPGGGRAGELLAAAVAGTGGLPPPVTRLLSLAFQAPNLP